MLRLLPLLLFLCAAVHGKELKCDEINYYKYCWNLETHRFKPCWRCLIKNQQISEPDQVIFIAPTHENGTVVDVEMVKFEGGDVKHMPKVMHNTNNKQIVQMQLIETNAPVLNAQFFGNAGPNVTYFFSGGNHNLSMEAFAFQSFTNLEYLGLNHNGISAIPTEAFRKLHKLILLNLDRNLLSLVQKDWFYDLGNLEILHLYGNQLEEIPENSFQDLTNLKELHLDENNMEIITMKMFKYNKQLQLIDLSSNQIRQIQSGAFAHLSQLARLKINENDCIDNDFENQTAEEVAEGLTECYPTKESTCVVPQILNGYIISIDDNTPQIPGALFAASGLVKVVCNSTFTQIHDKANQTTNRCLEEDWEDLQWPTCHRLCLHQEIVDPSFLAHCDRDGEDFPCSSNLLPGTRATIRCKTGFRNPKGLANPELTCQESGNWNQSAHKCESISGNVSETGPVKSGVSCPQQEINHFSIISYCERNDLELNCTDHLPPDTKVSIRCHFGYKLPPKAKSKMTCKASGKWSKKPFKCEPICGKVVSHSVALQIGGKDTNITEVPWHVGIYENDTQICGGTIISERVVISAAHCFSQNTDQMHNIDVKLFKVAAGKIVRGLYENETQATQIRDVLEVDISLKYDGSNTWWADIATIIIKGHFEYQQHIVPACIDFIEDDDKWYPKDGSNALVAGWGLNKDFMSSGVLQSFDIPVVDFDTCLEKAPLEFGVKIVDDKICAGYVNSNENLSKVVCKGDSGGGLLIPQTVRKEKRYYLQGVVSNSQSTKNCDTSFYTLFTNVQYYKNMIKKALSKN